MQVTISQLEVELEKKHETELERLKEEVVLTFLFDLILTLSPLCLRINEVYFLFYCC